MFKPSPLKHKEGHSMLTEEAHKEAHGGEITEDLPLPEDLTVFNTDNPKPPKSIEQAKVEKKSTDAKLENNTNESFFPNQVEPSVQDNTNQVQPIHLADPKGEDLKEDFWGDTNFSDYKRKNNKWYRTDGEEEIEVGGDPKTAGKKQTALLNYLNRSLHGGGKEIDPNDPQTWIGKDEKTIAAGLRASNAHPGITVDDLPGGQIRITLPNGEEVLTSADDPKSVEKYKKINAYYDTKPPIGKDRDLQTSLQFTSTGEFNKAWGKAGYKLEGGRGKPFKLTDVNGKVLVEGDGSTSLNDIKKYLHDNATQKDVANIKSAAIDETNNSILVADKERESIDENQVKKEGFNSYVSSGSFKNEMIFSLTGQQKEGTFDPNKPSTWGDEEDGGIIEGTGVSQSTLDMIDAYYDKNLNINKLGVGRTLKNGNNLTDLSPIIKTLQAVPEGSEGYGQAQSDIKVMQNLLPQLDKTLKSGSLKAKNEIIDGALETYQAQQYRENENQILVNMGAEYKEDESLVKKAEIDGKVDQMMGDYGDDIDRFEVAISSLADDAGKDGVSVSYDGRNFTVDGDDPEKVEFYKKKFSQKNAAMIAKGEDFSQTNADYKEKYKEWQNNHGKILDIENQSKREHDLFNINMSKFGDGFRSMAYSALSLVDEEAAISKKQAMETGAIGLESPIDYKTALKTGQKWRFATGELATQGANSIVAIASGGIGMGLGMSATGISMLTGYGVFGTFSGTQKYMDLTIQQQAGEEAKKGLANLEKFKGLYSPEDYMRTKMQYEKAIAFGDINADQKRAAAFTSFAVEGTITSFLGTVPNSLNLIKKFANPGAGIGNKLLRSNLRSAGAAAGQTAKGIAGEIIEETSIEALTTIGDGLILSRDMDFSHLDDVAVTSIISSGPMTAVPNTYAAIVQQTQTAEYRKEVNKSLNKMKEIEKRFATLGKVDPMREIYVDQYKAEVETIAGEHTKLEVDALALGADNVQRLVKAAVEENYLNQQAGITSKDNNKTIELKRNNYKESLNKADATDYQDRLDAINDQRKKIVENIDYEGATEKIFGDKGKHWDNKLKNNPEYKNADKRGKLAIILNKVRQDKVNSNVNKAKNDPRVKKFVEQTIYGEDGFEGSGRKNRKAKQENAMYDDMANGLLVNQRNANIAATEGNTNAATLLGNDRLKNLKIVDATDVDAINEAIYNNDGLTEEAKQGMVNSLKSGEAKGVIIDNQYIVLDKEGAQKNLDNGDLLQGTVVSHEISHFVDDASFENENEKAIYTHNLNGLISKTSPVIHELALDRTNGITDAEGKPLYDESKSFEEQSIDYKDEYTKSVQDMLMDPAFEREYQNIKNKSGVGTINRVRMALNKDFAADINTEKSAGAWMVGFIDNFKEGNLSPLARRKMDAKNNVGKKGIKFSREASEKVQNIYDSKGVDGAFDIIEQFKPIVGKIVQRRSEAPNFDRQLLTDEIETGKRGIYDLIKEYNPETGVPLAAYINKYLPSRAIEASQRVLGEEFTEDITERVDIAIEEEVTQDPTQFRRKKIILSDRLNVKGKVDKAIKAKLPNLDVDNLNFKTLKDQTPEITGEMFGISPKKLVSGANITKGELQSAQMFINKNADVLISMLPEGTTAGGTATGVPKTLLAPFYTKTDRAKMAKTGTKAGLAVQVKKPNISKTEFLEVFGIIDGKPVRTDRNTSARVLALANLTGKMMTNQAVREQLMKDKSRPFHSLGVLADGKSKVMFSQENKVGKDASEWAPGSISGISTPFIVITKNGVPQTGFRDTDAMFNKDTTWGQEGTRILNDFLEINPQFRRLFETTMTGGMKGGFFLTMPEFNGAINETNVKQVVEDLISYRIDYNKEEKLTNKGVDIFNDPDFKKDQIKRQEILYDFFKAVESYSQKNENDFWFFEELAKDTGKGQSAFSRVLAIYNFYPINENGKPNQKDIVVEEHSRPQNTMIKSGLLAAKDGRVDVEFKVIKASFMQGSFLKADDDIVGRAKLGDSMPDIFYTDIAPRLESGELVLPDGLAAVVRLAAPGTKYAPVNTNETVNLNNYYLPSEGKTVAEYFGVDMITDIALANEIIIERLAGKKTKGSGSTNYKFSKAVENSRIPSEAQGITVLDFDDTLATTKSNILTTAPDGTKGKMNAEQYAKNYEDLAAQGYKFDFSEFNKVVKGKIAPLFQKALKLQSKFGPESMFVLTARPPAAQKAIFEFLKANGLNIPMENITGLANSTSEAKAIWMAEKVADGYNDFYFADDALQNVQAVKNMLDQFDVKSKVQQAKVKFSKDASTTFNNIIEGSTGIESEKRFSDAQARLRGNKTKYKSIIPASAQDFQGLLYNFLGKGKKGEADMAFFKKALIDPFARGINELNSSRQAAANDFENLNKKFPKVKKLLNKKIEGLDYTHDQAARVYLWNKAGFEVPGLSKRDLKALVETVENNPELQTYADAIGLISKKEDGYSKPKEYWLAESIASDLLSDGAIGDARSSFLAEWKENRDQIFSPENLNKIEAIYGSKFREALEDILYRMETGRNRPTGSSRLVNGYMNWVNNSVGAIMFFNMRSATLQTISAANYMNWTDNNPAKAALAFANQPQFWKDFSMIFNSDYLKQRRSGNQRGINEAELSEAVAGSDNKAKTAIAWLLKKGFTPTQIADSFAISMGGATMLRNRINKYVKEGMTQKDAEAKAWIDFQETTEVNQQSARPDMISQQQASPLGRLILAFQNTPMQYARIMNKATRDLVNGRGDYKTHISKIAYYGVVQSIIFGALQSALYASLGDDDEEDFDKKKERILNQMVDSWLTGIGVGGKAIGTVKNTIMEYLKQRDKGWNADHAYTLLTILSFSPPIGSKLRKIYGSIKTEEFNRGVFSKRGFTLDNPIWSGVGHVIEGVTNIPLGRMSNLMLQADNAMDSSHKWWQRVALILGQNTWDLGIKDPDIEDVKTEIKEEKKEASKIKAKEKKEQKKKEQEEANKSVIEENKKKSKKDGICSAISKGGNRCKTKVVEGDSFCTVHEKATQNSTGVKSQCKKVKEGGNRCGMQTSSKSGYCYYHD